MGINSCNTAYTTAVITVLLYLYLIIMFNEGKIIDYIVKRDVAIMSCEHPITHLQNKVKRMSQLCLTTNETHKSVQKTSFTQVS